MKKIKILLMSTIYCIVVSNIAQAITYTKAPKLFMDYDHNEISASIKYNNKPIYIKGSLGKLARNNDGHIYINLRTWRRNCAIMAFLKDSQVSKAAKLANQDTIYLTCKTTSKDTLYFSTSLGGIITARVVKAQECIIDRYIHDPSQDEDAANQPYRVYHKIDHRFKN